MGVINCKQLPAALALLAIEDPYSPFRPKGIRDGAVTTVSPKTGVAFEWRFQRESGVLFL